MNSTLTDSVDLQHWMWVVEVILNDTLPITVAVTFPADSLVLIGSVWRKVPAQGLILIAVVRIVIHWLCSIFCFDGRRNKWILNEDLQVS